MPLKTVVSASRRTDIPAFYMPWFMRRLEAGFAETENPFNGRISAIDLRPESVHSIVFWSKNYGPFLEGGYAEKIIEMGHRLFFQFTVNTPSLILEPGVPPLRERFEQASWLSMIYGPEAVEWRFDPVCFYTDRNCPENGIMDNLGAFEEIAHAMAAAGIKSCVTSFLDIYRKVKKREESAGIVFVEPDQADKERTIEYMTQILNRYGVKLRLCCEQGMSGHFLKSSGIVTDRGCIDGNLLMEIHGGHVSVKPDRGQRKSSGCSCTESRDIGSYRKQPCFHKCLYCYAS